MTDPNRVTMEHFTGAREIKIGRGNFSNVGRDQKNYITIHQTVVQSREKKRKFSKDLLELSEFTEIKRGDIYKDNDVCYSWRLCSNGKEETEATVYHAEINITGSFGQRKFTVKTYRGRNAMKEWRRDFLRCSKDWDVPLFGYNMSSTPSLILCGELVPVAHIEGRLGLVGEYYVKLLRRSLGCSRNELWMDFRKGRFCRGPVGPRCRYSYDDPNTKNITVPLDLEFLEEEVIIRYLLGKQDDRELFYVLSYTGRSELLKDRPTTNYSPHVLSDSTGSMISFCQNLLWWSWKGCLDDRQLMPDGATRLRLTNNRRYVEVSPAGDPSTWLSQALSVFHSHNISLDEDLSTYQLIYPYIKLAGKVQKSKRKQRRRRLHAPIYLFLLPSPFSCRFGRRFYSWSLDPTGRIPLSLDMCKYLGLPYKLSSKILYFLTSWSTKTYKTIHNYQIARGFDPRTTDLAQTLRYQIHAIVPRENPFQEVEEGGVSSYTCTSREPLPGGRGQNEISAKSLDLPLPAVNNVEADQEANEVLPDQHLVIVRPNEGSKKESELASYAKFAQTANPVSTQIGVRHSLVCPLFAPFTRIVSESSDQDRKTSLSTLSDVD